MAEVGAVAALSLHLEEPSTEKRVFSTSYFVYFEYSFSIFSAANTGIRTHVLLSVRPFEGSSISKELCSYCSFFQGLISYSPPSHQQCLNFASI